MDFINFIIVSTIEYIGFFCAMLAIYRFEIKPYVSPIIATSLLSSFISHALRIKYELSMAPVIQLLILIVLFCFIFKVQIIYSGIMVVTVSVAYIALQTLLLLVLPSSFWFTASELQQVDSLQIYTFQVLCAIINLGTATILVKRRIGFTFVPTSNDISFPWLKQDRHLFIAIIIVFSVLSVTYYLYHAEHFHILALILLLLMFVAAMVFHYLRFKEYNQ
jgi:hypothetical protein